MASLLLTNAHVALADDLLPPPPPPPGENPKPTPQPDSTGSDVLEAPPPPPPGVHVEPPPNIPPSSPPTSTPDPSPTPSTSKPSDLAAPPTAPAGVTVDGPKPKPAKVTEKPRLAAPMPHDNTLPSYRPEDKPQQTTAGGWYGWKSLIGLVPVYGLFIGAIVSDESTLLVPAVIGGVMVTPVAHWTHGNKGFGWLSFGVNIGTMFIGGATGGAEGAAIGLGIWNVIDIAAFHHKRSPASPPPPTRQAITLQSIGVVPMMDHGRKGFTVFGQF